jgi:hypothetical protein
LAFIMKVLWPSVNVEGDLHGFQPQCNFLFQTAQLPGTQLVPKLGPFQDF